MCGSHFRLHSLVLSLAYRRITNVHIFCNTVWSPCTTGAMEVLVGLPPLDLVIQGEARSAAHHLWSLGCWSYLHPPTRTQLHIDSTSEVRSHF